jgi:hypothetical protein
MERTTKWVGIAVATSVVIACGGGSGSASTRVLARSTLEAAGANCSSGGHRLEFGPDSNGSGQLEDSEVQGSAYTCTAVIPPGDARCPAGGTVLRIGGVASGPAPELAVCNGTMAQASPMRKFARSQVLDGRWVLECPAASGLTCATVFGPGGGLGPMIGGMSIENDPALLTKLCTSIGASGLDSSVAGPTANMSRMTWSGSSWDITTGVATRVESFTCTP